MSHKRNISKHIKQRQTMTDKIESYINKISDELIKKIMREISKEIKKEAKALEAYVYKYKQQLTGIFSRMSSSNIHYKEALNDFNYNNKELSNKIDESKKLMIQYAAGMQNVYDKFLELEKRQQELEKIIKDESERNRN